MIIALTGASGFIGKRLIARLQQDNYTVRALGRHDPHISGVEFVRWDALKEEPPAVALRDAGAVINLAGEPVAQRWSKDVKRRIADSRVLGTANLVSAIGKLETRPIAMISASAIGYYGDRGDTLLPESAKPGRGFLADVCVDWEQEARQAGTHDVRVAILRLGVVLGPDGGALTQMLAPFHKGLGGPIGSGKQWMSWIHINDVVDLFAFALRHEHIFGTLNATSPNPVQNAEFAKTLGAAIGRSAVVPAPAIAVKLMFGEMASVILDSQRVVPEAASRHGFVHKFPDLRDALKNVLT